MAGLANALMRHGPVKIFADKSENYQKYDESIKLDVERFGGIKLLRKYRKANRICEYIEDNNTYLYLTGGGIFTGDTKEELDYVDVDNVEKVLSRDIIWDNEKIDNSTYLAAWNVNNTGGGLFRWSNNKLENINSLYDIKCYRRQSSPN